MKYLHFRLLILIVYSMLLLSCEFRVNENHKIAAKQSILDTGKVQPIAIEEIPKKIDSLKMVTTALDSPNVIKPLINKPIGAKPKALELVNFAKSLLKTPYIYGGKEPKTGFDSAGFISFVFNHFNISVPTTANEFSNVGKTISLSDVSEGDLILISKSDVDKKIVGYVGIITSEKGKPIEFIYANAGKVKAVTISTFNSYYQKRLVKMVSVLP